MKVVFAGTPEAAVPTLDALLKSQHEIVAVLTIPDRPAGRGRRLSASPVKECAKDHSLLTLQPERLGADVQSTLKKIVPDVMVIVAYGLLLPKEVLTIPTYGCVNLHFSLLPRWRGASPIQHTLLYGDEMTGVSVMQMDEGLDTGPILAQEAYPVDPDENSQMLHDRLAKAGAQLLLKTLDAMAVGNLHGLPQDAQQATYAPKIKKSQGLIRWQQPARVIMNQVRAFNSWPVAFTYFEGKRLRIWHAEVVNVAANVPPGTVMEVNKLGIEVATGDKVLRVHALQLPGGRVLSAVEFLNAHEVLPGETVFLEE